VSDSGCPGSATSAAATINITVNGPVIWFVDPVGGLTTNSGRMASPVQKIADLTGRTANDGLFVYSGTHTGGVTLLSGEKLIGQGYAIAGFDSAFGITPPAGTFARPNTKFNDNTR